MNILKKIKDYVNAWTEKITTSWAERSYLNSVLTFLLPPSAIGVAICIIFKIITDVSTFLRLHYAKLILAVLILWAFWGWLDAHKERQLEYRRREREEEEREEYRTQQECMASKDLIYIEQGKILFDVTREVASLGIVPPMRLNNLYSPSRTIPKMNGAFFLCQYLLQKDLEFVDTERLKETLQMKINQRLIAGDYPGVEAKHLFRGRVYNGLMIDKVIDSRESGFVEVYTVLVNNAYCRWKERQDLDRDAPAPSIDRRDADY